LNYFQALFGESLKSTAPISVKILTHHAESLYSWALRGFLKMGTVQVIFKKTPE
jgi:hypothetical protein